MFLINHNKQFVYSTIIVTAKKLPLEEETIRDLMFIWSNKTMVPYLNWMKKFLTDNTKWYLK